MYYPFLRGKREELAAISESISIIKDSKNIIPIIEPMNLNSYTKSFFKTILEEQIKLLLIINSKHINEKNTMF